MDNAEIITNEKGARQSYLPYRFDLIPKEVMQMLANIFKYGADKYEAYGWVKISVDDHINHAIAHLYNYLDERRYNESTDEVEPELAHAFCRLAFACYIASVEDNAVLLQKWHKDKQIPCEIFEEPVTFLKEKKAEIDN